MHCTVVFTDVLGYNMGPIFKCQTLLDCWNLEDVVKSGPETAELIFYAA